MVFRMFAGNKSAAETGGIAVASNNLPLPRVCIIFASEMDTRLR